MMLYCLLFAVLVCAESKKDCGINAEWKCGTPCQITCSNMNSPVGACVGGCREGCFCKDNYFRNYAGICVRKGECFSCPANSTYSKCALNCQRTCNFQSVDNQLCTEDCKANGCNCNEGFVKEHKTGRCILELDCPRPDCGKNEEWQSCGTPCPISCYNLDKPNNKMCIKSCAQGCFCKKNFFRNYAGECVPKTRCASCPANNTYSTCGLSCQRTCDPQPQYFAPCVEDCHIDGCNCEEGYVISHDTGTCILESDCPAQDNTPNTDCPQNTTFTSCAPCESSCNSEPRMCSMLCRETGGSCTCEGGFVRGPEGNCILSSDCPTLKKCH